MGIRVSNLYQLEQAYHTCKQTTSPGLNPNRSFTPSDQMDDCAKLLDPPTDELSTAPTLEDNAEPYEYDEELRSLLVPDLSDLPPTPPSAIESNFATYFLPDFTKPGHDHYVHRHPNGLCVIGLAPTHLAFKANQPATSVDFNVGKSNRSEIKVSGKHKKNALHFEPNTALCKVFVKEESYVVRCCVKGSLLEVNEKLIKHPELLNSSASREGYIAIIMPRPADWLKFKNSALTLEDYKKLRDIS